MKKEKVLTIHPQGPTLEEAVNAVNAKLPAEATKVKILKDEVTPAEKQALFDGMANNRKSREQ